MWSSLRGLCGPVRSKLGAITYGLGLPAGAVFVRETSAFRSARTHSRTSYFSLVISHHITFGLVSGCVCLLHSCTRQGEIIARLAAKPTILSSCHQLTYSSRTEAACMQTPPLLRLNQEVHRSAAAASWFVWIRSGPCPCHDTISPTREERYVVARTVGATLLVLAS